MSDVKAIEWLSLCRPLQSAAKGDERPKLADRMARMLLHTNESADFGRLFLIGKTKEPITGFVHMMAREVKSVLADAETPGPITMAPDVDLDESKRAAFVSLWLDANGWLTLEHAMRYHSLAEMFEMCTWVQRLDMPGGDSLRSWVLAKAATMDDVKSTATRESVVALIKQSEAVAKKHKDVRMVIQRTATAAAAAARFDVDLKELPYTRFAKAALAGDPKELIAEFKANHGEGSIARDFINLIKTQLQEMAAANPARASQLMLGLGHMIRNEMGISDVELPKAATNAVQTATNQSNWKQTDQVLRAQSPFLANYIPMVMREAKTVIETHTAIATGNAPWTDKAPPAAPAKATAAPAAAAATAPAKKEESKVADDFVL